MEQVTDYRQGIELTLRTRTEQRRDHLLPAGPAPRAIPAADLAQHDGRADGLFGALAEVVRCFAPGLIMRLRTSRFGHAILMPNSLQKYKEKRATARDSGPQHQAESR